ncbi:MAG: hypothetical protein E7479_00055 [Ruminococcaceae bacterium]|nr:hypothetical protein [Oscillospiraceae bacterium]
MTTRARFFPFLPIRITSPVFTTRISAVRSAPLPKKAISPKWRKVFPLRNRCFSRQCPPFPFFTKLRILPFRIKFPDLIIPFMADISPSGSVNKNKKIRLWKRRIFCFFSLQYNGGCGIIFYGIFFSEGRRLFLKTLIIYSSKTGTTKKCAALLAANIGADSCDLFEISEEIPEISGYDCVAIGSYVRMGVIDKKISAFLQKHKEELFGTKFGLFICSCLSDKVSDAITKNFPEEFMDHAAIIDHFGGELQQDKIKGFDKIIVNSILRISKTDPNFRIADKIIPESITNFSNVLKEI